jgi:hypothetical protein
MVERERPVASNGSGGRNVGGGRTSFSDVARAHWRWDVESADASDAEREKARRAFDAILAEFERSEIEQTEEVDRGRLFDDYWCQRKASGVALAEFWTHGPVLSRSRRFLKWLRFWHPVPQYRIFRQSDWVTVEFPQLANLLHECDVLAVKAQWGLEGIYQAVVLPWLMSVEKHVLGFVESEYRRRKAERPARPANERAGEAAVRETRAERTTREREERQRERRAEERIESFSQTIQSELSRIEDYYQRAGAKQARLHYLAGMAMLGLPTVAIIGLVSAGGLATFGLLHLHDGGVRRFYACMAAGALGAIVSVLIRMGGRGGGFNIDHELGSAGVRRLGAFRPIVGAITGVTISLLVQTSLVPIKPTALTFHFYVVVAFLAGFSERWTKVVLEGAMRTIEKAGADKEQEPAKKGSPAPADDGLA